MCGGGGSIFILKMMVLGTYAQKVFGRHAPMETSVGLKSVRNSVFFLESSMFGFGGRTQASASSVLGGELS